MIQSNPNLMAQEAFANTFSGFDKYNKRGDVQYKDLVMKF